VLGTMILIINITYDKSETILYWKEFKKVTILPRARTYNTAKPKLYSKVLSSGPP